VRCFVWVYRTVLSFLTCDVALWTWHAKLQTLVLWTIYAIIRWHLAPSRFFFVLQVREGCVQVLFFSICLFQKKYTYGKTTSLYALHLLQEASSAVPLFSPVIVPMAQSFGPILSQLTSYPTIRFGVRYVSVTLVSTLFLEMFNTYAGYFFMLTLLMFTLG